MPDKTPAHARKPRSIKIPEWLQTLAVFLVGLIGSPFLEALISKTFNTDYRIFILILVVCAVVVILISFQVRKYVDVVRATVKDGVDGMTAIGQQASAAVDTIAEKHGAFFRINKFGKGSSLNPIDEYLPLIENAHEIFALDCYPWHGEVSDEQQAMLGRWYAALDRHVTAGKPYIRILQCEKGRTNRIVVNAVRNPAAEQHLTHLVNSAGRAQPFYLYSCAEMLPAVVFAVIDRKYVIWEVPMRDLEPSQDGVPWHFSLDLIFDDHTGVNLQALLEIWNVVLEKSCPVKSVVVEG